MKNHLYLRLIVCLFLLPATSSAAEKMLYFPPATGAWEQVDPAQLGWNVDRLKDAINYAGEQKSSGVVILYRGRILLEKYWPLDTSEKDANGRPNRYFHMRVGKNAQGRAIEDVASAQKSVTAMLVGIAQHKGLLKIEDPVHKHLGTGWSRAPAKAEAKITIRHLITMTSGLTTDLKYEVPAGTKWKYNTAAYSRALTCAAKAAKLDVNEITSKWLTDPIVFKDSRWAGRPWIAQRPDVNKFGFATTARDLARFGLLMMADGNWNGETVIADKAYIKAATSPSQKLNTSYGYLWWLNVNRTATAGNNRTGRMIFAAPQDMFAAKGALVRRLFVVPSRHVVITRLGDQPAKDFDTQFFKRLKLAIEK